MLRFDPNSHPDDPEVIGFEDWAMRQTQTAIFAILRYFYDWGDAAYDGLHAPALLNRLINDPATDFGIIAFIFGLPIRDRNWSTRETQN